ncbi:Uncharacterised protein [Yersinia aleksiciae]|uniref:Uncharacterized protein n=1 Tax=Yersinia aleksiciae TaxID=263819 RepID=A0A0T9UFQ1_YERAE|nr:Uncharacterised protein [Yersinia aleksiciae]
MSDTNENIIKQININISGQKTRPKKECFIILLIKPHQQISLIILENSIMTFQLISLMSIEKIIQIYH